MTGSPDLMPASCIVRRISSSKSLRCASINGTLAPVLLGSPGVPPKSVPGMTTIQLGGSPGWLMRTMRTALVFGSSVAGPRSAPLCRTSPSPVIVTRWLTVGSPCRIAQSPVALPTAPINTSAAAWCTPDATLRRDSAQRAASATARPAAPAPAATAAPNDVGPSAVLPEECGAPPPLAVSCSPALFSAD